MEPTVGPEFEVSSGRFGWPSRKVAALIVLLYAGVLAVATYPTVLSLGSTTPDRWDVPQHLWVMRWYKTCLLEGRRPWICPEVQYPAGGPLGNFSPLHLQALLYLPMSFVIRNDVLCYNLLWIGGLLLTGLGTAVLCAYVVRDWRCAAFGGALGMLSGPMMVHAGGHLELIYLGGFPLFLTAWMRFVDRPTAGRAALAAAGYVVLAMCAAYFMVFAIFPAALYAVWAACREGRRGVLPWVRSRVPWMCGWAALALPALALLFGGHIWAAAHGYSAERGWAEFERFGAPVWAYVAPTPLHAMSGPVAVVAEWATGRRFDSYQALGSDAGERSAYLGVVTLGLMAYAAVTRAGGRRLGYIWATFGLLVVLSLGASQTVFGYRLSLPAGWLWSTFPPMRFTRVPARICLFAAVVAAVPAAAGLRRLLATLRGARSRGAVFAGLAVLAVADLARFGFPRETPAPMPGCYEFVRKTDPKATLLEMPYEGSGGSVLNAACTYWQARHRLTTTAGYSGQRNLVQDERIGFSSPVEVELLRKPGYLDDPRAVRVDIGGPVDFHDYLWLYMTAHKLDYLVVHKWWAEGPEDVGRLARVMSLLEDGRVFEDGASAVYARARLRRPSGPVQMTLGGWPGRREVEDVRWGAPLGTARVAVYSPGIAAPMDFQMRMSAMGRPRSVGLFEGGRELARWTVEGERFRDYTAPELRLAEGVHELTVESGPLVDARGAERARRYFANRLGLVRVARIQASAAGGEIAAGKRTEKRTR